MSAQLLDGSGLAKRIKAGLKAEIGAFEQTHGDCPALAVVRIGDDEAAAGYGRAIEKNCASVGVEFVARDLPADVDEAEVLMALRGLNREPSVHGIMVLEPVPAAINLDHLVAAIDPAKDVDGVNPTNAGRLLANRPPFFVPATPAGGLRLLQEAGVEFKGKHAVVVGRSDIVGKPMALLLLHNHCTVTIAHSRTVDLPAVCRSADILCVAVGRPEMVQGDWVKPGAVVVDFGTNYTDQGLKGDCHQASVAEVAGMLTPVPGGTGPMTNAMLMANVLQAALLAVTA
ncbi:MAG: bifunctional 5,10-methylene-tetrahydrofolate dehydrogenase/5,10-methylene-tetrahydrofolate cyclohydrolase [Chloroflexi bacterium]|nr:MAG: bifunctional 5,10-methylene-tetrahydrofolate dehydrogenase/5,10-methylene-tetrahydrofolate cyclohydrolase [Chloroflexota bacterium]